MSEENDRELGLYELLESLGKELREANERAGTKGAATLAWAEATVEVELEVKRTKKGGIQFSVLGIGAEGGADRATGRTVRAQVRCVPAQEPFDTSSMFTKAGGLKTRIVGKKIHKSTDIRGLDP